MRQYRGLTKDGKWMHGWYAEKQDSHYNSYSVIINDEIEDEVIPKTVGQSTGLKDKNGKEIYEGDIIELAEDTYGETELPINCVVKWNDKGFYQLWRNGIIHWKFWREDTYHNTGYRKNWKVIGDIHTTPKLLEKPK